MLFRGPLPTDSGLSCEGLAELELATLRGADQLEFLWPLYGEPLTCKIQIQLATLHVTCLTYRLLGCLHGPWRAPTCCEGCEGCLLLALLAESLT